MLKTTFINSTVAEYTDAEFSWLQADVLETGYFADKVGNKKFQVTERSPAVLGVAVTAGKILVPFSKGGVNWAIIVEQPSDENFSITANSSGANRVDAVIVKLDTSADPNALKTNIATLQVLQGTGTSPLTDGAIQTTIGAGYTFTRLANITVPTGATSITDSDITNSLTKVRISKAVDFYSESIVTTTGESNSTSISVNTSAPVTKYSPASVMTYDTYTTDTTSQIYETISSTGQYNKRSGIYSLHGLDWLFGNDGVNIFFVTKTSGSSGAWSSRTNIGVAVFNGSYDNWSIGCDESTNTFHLIYNKNAGSSDGKLYYRKLTANAGGTITTGSEVVAWEEVGWSYTQSSVAGGRTLDSEYVNDGYYVVFQKNDGAGNYIPTIIGNTASDGTWVNKVSLPQDLDSSFAKNSHGRGVAIACIGNKKIGTLWLRRTSTSDTVGDLVGNAQYREFDTVTVSLSASVACSDSMMNLTSVGFPYMGTDSWSYISFIDTVPIVCVRWGDSSFSGNIPFRYYRRQSASVWLQNTEMLGGTTVAQVGISTRGNIWYMANQYNVSGAGSTQGFALHDSVVPYTGSRNTIRQYSSPGYASIYWQFCMLAGVQNGKGIQNVIGAIGRQTSGSTSIVGWYTSQVKRSTITSKVTNFLIADESAQFIGIFAKDYLTGENAEIITSGNIDTDVDLIPNRKCFLGNIGIRQHQYSGSVYIGDAIGKNTIKLNIDNKVDLRDKSYKPVVDNDIALYDGIIRMTAGNYDGTGVPAYEFSQVFVGDNLTRASNPVQFGGAFPDPTVIAFKRTQK